MIHLFKYTAVQYSLRNETGKKIYITESHRYSVQKIYKSAQGSIKVKITLIIICNAQTVQFPVYQWYTTTRIQLL